MEYFSGETETGNFNNAVHFAVDDLLDFSKDDETITDAFRDSVAGNSGDSSTVTAVDSCNSSVSGGGGGRSFNDFQFAGNELCVPTDDLAELEWLSNFVEESFSVEDLRFIPVKTAIGETSSSTTTTQSVFPSDVSVPGKARSKRSRAAPCDWSSRLLHLSTNPKSAKKREATETPGRKCLHCSSEKTPQWRTGPMGPKTLCNACGVRYKSGRLVSEYRPAASPTFVSTKHSNSHRKVLELRRQKELQIQQNQQLITQASIFNGCDEFLIHHGNNFNGPDMRHMNPHAY